MRTSEIDELACRFYIQALLAAGVLTQWTMANLCEALLLHIHAQRLGAGGHCDSVVLLLQPNALAGGHDNQPL